MLEARRVKQPAELAVMRIATARVEDAVAALELSLHDGMCENEAWAAFHGHLIANGGEYVVARLFQSGPNTFPYFRESGERRMRDGDLVCLDTDAVVTSATPSTSPARSCVAMAMPAPRSAICSVWRSSNSSTTPGFSRPA
jgi:Xaa-Pro aminopeptidase